MFKEDRKRMVKRLKQQEAERRRGDKLIKENQGSYGSTKLFRVGKGIVKEAKQEIKRLRKTLLTAVVVALLVVLVSTVGAQWLENMEPTRGFGAHTVPAMLIETWRAELRAKFVKEHCTVFAFKLLWFTPTITLVFIEEINALSHSEPPIPPAPPPPPPKKKKK